MKTLNKKDDVLKKDDHKTIEVEVPEWDCKVILRTISGTMRDRFEQQTFGKSSSNVRAKFLVLCIVDDKGERIFNDADAATLGMKSSVALDRLFSEAAKLNRIGEAEIEDAAKN